MADYIKSYVFETLPRVSGKLVVVAWGRIVNDRSGSYHQEVVLKRYKEGENPSLTWNLRDSSSLFYCEVNLGSLRVFAPGTIVQQQKVIRFPHEYLEKIDFQIDDPQSLISCTLRRMYDPIFPEWEREHMNSPVGLAECRLLETSQPKLLIPCNVIADYYYYGMTFMVKAILEGRIDEKYSKMNDVYNPKRSTKVMSDTGKVVVRVQLQNKMSFEDKFKIARLAFDGYFRFKCLDIYTSILKGNQQCYIKTDIPLNEPTTLSVYGVEINNGWGNFFLVHAISKCTSKPPFDLIIAGKDFSGKSLLQDTEGGGSDESDPTDDRPGVYPRVRSGRKHSKTQLKKGDKKNIGKEKSSSSSEPENIAFPKDQKVNFPDESAINERDFYDPKKTEKLTEILRKIGFANQLTTNPSKSGSSRALLINIFGTRPKKPKLPQEKIPFERVEELTLFLETFLTGASFSIQSRIRCPVPEGTDKYSIFPVNLLPIFNNEKISKKYRNFCFKDVREKRHSDPRRIYIKELVVNGRVFYIIDIEPKYKVMNKENKAMFLVSSFAVIFFVGGSQLSDEIFKEVLLDIVMTHGTPVGRWRFLNQKWGYSFQLIRHRTYDKNLNSIIKFIVQKSVEKP